jgi:hypothetical protein
MKAETGRGIGSLSEEEFHAELDLARSSDG